MPVLEPQEPGPEDEALVRDYPQWREKGAVADGRRITLMTAQSSVRCGEEIRVVHVAEALDAGSHLFLMRAKQVAGETVDGKPATPAALATDDPFRPNSLYDGPVTFGPGVDSGWQVTRYRFDRPGEHEIVWKPGSLVSNGLQITVR